MVRAVGSGGLERLSDLRLGNCRVGGGVCAELVSCLGAQCPRLSVLSLCGNWAVGEGAAVVTALAEGPFLELSDLRLYNSGLETGDVMRLVTHLQEDPAAFPKLSRLGFGDLAAEEVLLAVEELKLLRPALAVN